MISAFYRNYSGWLLTFVLVTFPIAAYYAETIPCNNDIETWLPDESVALAEYNEFRGIFGADESIVIGYETTALNTTAVEALCRRLERLTGIKHCWSPDRLQAVMSDLEVSHDESLDRLRNLVVSSDDTYRALLVVLDDEGIAHRADTVKAVRHQLRYSQLTADDVSLAGSPVVVAELDRLGNRDNNKVFFIITLAICLGLLQLSVRCWKLSLSIVGLTIWAIDVTLGVLHLCGAEMNFILSALPVLVMVFTLAVSIHFLHHFHDSYGDSDPLRAAIAAVWKPSMLATVTTVIGLLSLAVSSIGPVKLFGISASVGSVVALIAGLGILPAVLVMLGIEPREEPRKQLSVYRAAWILVQHARSVTVGVGALVILCGIGLPWLSSRIDPIDFLPEDARVLHDVRQIERKLTSSDCVEVIVDFGISEQTFFDRLAEVRRLQTVIAGHEDVTHTMSLASFLPGESGSVPASLLTRAHNSNAEAPFVADAQRLWRISARLSPKTESTPAVVQDIQALTAGAPVTVTGLTPVLDKAQQDIFAGFWESFATAFLLISLVMLLALRSLKAGLLAMIPNLTPISIVFGILGWLDIPVDIGTMMTASIALGLAVDGTFHFLFAHHREAQDTVDPVRCTHLALCRTGMPILSAAVISAIGMLALTLSNFNPTVKFGYMMCTLLLTALLGDLILLPAILALRRSITKRAHRKPSPHFGTMRRPSSQRTATPA